MPKTARATAPEERQARATAILSLLSGAVSASRAVVQADPALADHILAAAGDAVDRLKSEVRVAPRIETTTRPVLVELNAFQERALSRRSIQNTLATNTRILPSPGPQAIGS